MSGSRWAQRDDGRGHSHNAEQVLDHEMVPFAKTRGCSSCCWPCVAKTFVDGTDGGSEDAALARAILKIARSLGLHCIAEGVERAEQAAALREAGCEFAQGFLFAKPVSPARIAAMVQSWAAVALDPAS